MISPSTPRPACVNFLTGIRSGSSLTSVPPFDLDNLYGRGPDDQPYMYGPDGIRMLLGEPLSGNPHDPHAAQVPRGPSGRALIGDPRNNENRIVAQLHAIFLRFHNQVADHFGGEASLQMVRDQVRRLPVDAGHGLPAHHP